MNTSQNTSRIAAISATMGPLLLIGAAIVHHPHSGGAASWLAAAEAGRTGFYLAHLTFLIAIVLTLPAMVELGRRVSIHTPTLAIWGTGLAVIGGIGIAALVGQDLVVWQMASPSHDQASMLALLDDVAENAAILAPLFALASGVVIGPALLAAALARARDIPWTAAVLIATGPALLFAGLNVKPLMIAGGTFLLVGLRGVIPVRRAGGERRAPPIQVGET